VGAAFVVLSIGVLLWSNEFTLEKALAMAKGANSARGPLPTSPTPRPSPRQDASASDVDQCSSTYSKVDGPSVGAASAPPAAPSAGAVSAASAAPGTHPLNRTCVGVDLDEHSAPVAPEATRSMELALQQAESTDDVNVRI
jgi:hypothetical protein